MKVKMNKYLQEYILPSLGRGKGVGLSSLCALCLLCVLCVACTDTWDEHYDVTEGGMADQPTLLENIKSDASLANFYRAIVGIGGEATLNSPQQLTVWAPTGMTKEQADSIIAVYQNDKANYESKFGTTQKWADNKAVKQFFQNHVALYSRSVSSLTDDTIAMMNRKYMHLVGTSQTQGSLDGNPFNEAVTSSNGMLYKVDHLQRFFPNVREYLEQQTRLDSISELIADYDEYELDEEASVPGEVVDGKTQYLDSVTVLYNPLLMSYGYIQREDSTYSLIAPTNEVWTKLYNEYKNYYVYNPTVLNSDSLAEANTKFSIVRGLFFNTSAENKFNRHPEDSLVNTSYFERQQHNPRRNVYYHPFDNGGILSGLESVECSNGRVYIDNKGVIDPRTTFFYRTDLSANFAQYYEIPKNATNEDRMNISQGQVLVYDNDSAFNILNTYNFVEVSSKTPSDQSEIAYKLPSILSGVYYNIYVVTIPDMNTGLPCWFQVKHTERNAKGNFPTAQSFVNPYPVTEGSVENSDVLIRQSNYNRCYVASNEKIDTILIQSAVQFPYSSVGVDDEMVRLSILSFGPSSPSYREAIYTRTLRLCEIILVPFATKEEAEAAADDIDAFNDELLEANKEN